jgi:IS5 family transposase
MPCRRSSASRAALVGRGGDRPSCVALGGYDFPSCRRALRGRGITPRVARRGVESSTRLGGHRRKVEGSLAWLLANRRLMSATSAAPTS